MNWHAIQTGLMIGALVAIAISSCIALFQFDSGAPWLELLEMWGKMLLLAIPTFASSTAAALLVWHERRNVPGLPTIIGAEISPDYIPLTRRETMRQEETSLPEMVVDNALDQASWHYEWGKEPTRRLMQERGVSQTIWNSGRHILTVAGIVDGNEWSPEPWIVVEAALARIHAEPDRVWVSPLGERGMVCLHIDEKARNKRFTSPTPPLAEPEA